jgi:hypothetical protein
MYVYKKKNKLFKLFIDDSADVSQIQQDEIADEQLKNATNTLSLIPQIIVG